jgi:hypothetical protein
MHGKTSRVAGKTAHVASSGSHGGKTITTITSEGRDDPTAAEAQRTAYVLQVLQGKVEMLDENPWIQNVWLASGNLTWPEGFFVDSLPLEPLPVEFMSRPLNESQLTAVNHMLSRSKDDCVSIIQGDDTCSTSKCNPYLIIIPNRPSRNWEDKCHRSVRGRGHSPRPKGYMARCAIECCR